MHLFPARAGLVALLCAFVAPGCRSTKPQRVAPDFTLRDSDGRTVRLSEYHGKVVLLNFWATWCGPCAIEIPWFVEFERRHKDQGFAVLGISMDEDGWEAVRPYMSRIGINYRILMGNDEVARVYGGVDSLPTSFLIDREGKVAKVHVGLVSRSRYENELNELLSMAGNGGDRSARPSAVAGGAE